jgi:hypothetical protein
MTDLVLSQQGLARVRTIKDVLNARRSWLAADCSSSMSYQVGGEDTRTRLDALREATAQLREVEKLPFRQLTFGAAVEIREDIPDAAGGTPLALALRTIQEHRPSRIVVVSDGEPDSQSEALAVAAELAVAGCVIDVLYIGPPGGPGAEFLRKLSEGAGGRFATNDLTSGVRALTTQVRDALLALPPAPPAIAL